MKSEAATSGSREVKKSAGRVEWLKRSVSIICDRRIVKGKIYKTCDAKLDTVALT